jgi:quercetin dioxygenase-like cupin family protein
VPEKITIGGLELEFLHSKEETAGSLDLFKMTVQPNAKVPAPHYHESWDEAVYGLSGSLTFRIDGQEVVIGPGQSTFIKRGAVHSFKNDTAEAASCLSVLTPGLGPGAFSAHVGGRATRPGEDKGDHAALRIGPRRSRRLVLVASLLTRPQPRGVGRHPRPRPCRAMYRAHSPLKQMQRGQTCSLETEEHRFASADAVRLLDACWPKAGC